MRIPKQFRIALIIPAIMVIGGATLVWFADFRPPPTYPAMEPFFKNEWAMSPTEIRALHTELPQEAEIYEGLLYELKYPVTMLDHSGTLTYCFAESGLVFKRRQLISIDYDFPLHALSATECQKFAESLMMLIKPYYTAGEYDYHGHAVASNTLEKTGWLFAGHYLNKNMCVAINGIKQDVVAAELSLAFMKETGPMRKSSLENHENALSFILAYREKYGEFNYDK